MGLPSELLPCPQPIVTTVTKVHEEISPIRWGELRQSTGAYPEATSVPEGVATLPKRLSRPTHELVTAHPLANAQRLPDHLGMLRPRQIVEYEGPAAIKGSHLANPTERVPSFDER